MDNVATICQSGFSGCLLACLAKRMGLCGVVRGATRENGKKRFGNFAARYGLLLAFGKVSGCLWGVMLRYWLFG